MSALAAAERVRQVAQAVGVLGLLSATMPVNLALAGACAFFLLGPPAAALVAFAWLPLLAVALVAFLVSTHLDEIAELAR